MPERAFELRSSFETVQNGDWLRFFAVPVSVSGQLLNLPGLSVNYNVIKRGHKREVIFAGDADRACFSASKKRITNDTTDNCAAKATVSERRGLPLVWPQAPSRSRTG